jgi:AbrB family looped-hinge helix DNA binding protein
MRELTTTLPIDKAGRINVPKHIRESLKIKSGDLVKVTLSKVELEGEPESG